MKRWGVEGGGEVFYVGWVGEGIKVEGDSGHDPTQSQQLSWRPKVLGVRGAEVFCTQYPPVSLPYSLKFILFFNSEMILFLFSHLNTF
jgi:hypothetical protein